MPEETKRRRTRRPVEPKAEPQTFRPLIGDIIAALQTRKDKGKKSPFSLDAARPFPGVVPKQFEMAMDSAISEQIGWANSSFGGGVEEGLVFPGYAILAEMAQRAEYRAISETLATAATREWIDLKSAGEDDKTEKLKELADALDHFQVKAWFKTLSEQDGFFGRSHLYVDTGATDDREELKTPIGNGRDAMSRLKIGKGKLKGFRTVEPMWTYPTRYESSDPLKASWYRPDTWFVMGKEVHRTRLLRFVAREVPDILKPAYQFGGLSMSQMCKPYVDNWLLTRQSVTDLIHARIVWVLATTLDTSTAPGFQQTLTRAETFNTLRDNANLMMINKDSEEFKAVEGSLAGLYELQAQAQEMLCSVSHTPAIQLLGVQPTGFNASSDGEHRAWEDWVKSYQEAFFRPNLTTVIDFVELHLWGEVDDDITFGFKKIRQLSDKEIAELEKTLADTRAVDIEFGVVTASTARAAVIADPDSQYAGLIDEADEDETGGFGPGFGPPPAPEAGEIDLDKMMGPGGQELPPVRGLNPAKADSPERLMRQALGGARSLNAANDGLAYDSATAFADQYGIAFECDQDVTDVATGFAKMAAQTLDYLDQCFGLKPGATGVKKLHIRQPEKVEGCAGDYENGVISLASDLKPGVNRLFPGIRKQAAAASEDDPLHFHSVLRHEIGHAWKARFLAEARKIDPSFGLDAAFDEAKPETAALLTRYSAENPDEWFAESFGAWTHPDYPTSGVEVAPRLAALFRRLIPSEYAVPARAQDRKSSQAEVGYVGHPIGDERCGLCTMFRAPDSCSAVMGDISPDGHCRLFRRAR